MLVVEGRSFTCVSKSASRCAIRCISKCRCLAISVYAANAPFGSIQKGPAERRPAPRVKGLAVMLYLLGLSYGAVSLALEGLGIALWKSRVYDAVKEAASRVPGLKREQVFAGVKTPALGGDLTSVKCKGEWLTLGISVDAISGLALTIDALTAEDSQALQEWIEPIAKSVEATVLVTDDADGFKTVADEAGLQHQVCKAHVLRNTDTLIERYQPLVAKDADGSLAAIGVSPQQAAADLERLGELVRSRQREQAAELETMHRRYLQASPPHEGEHQSVAYRLRLLLTSSLEPLASLDALSPMERT